MPVDIGGEAINRGSWKRDGLTFINKATPAAIAGKVTSVDIWAFSNITGLRVGTFYLTRSGSTLKCRASEAIAGTITAGSKVNKETNIEVEIGDYIGYYFTSGGMENDLSGYAGLWGKDGEYIDPNDEVEYNLMSGDCSSLGGYIGAVAAGRSFGFIIG